MPRVTHVLKARKDNPVAKKGESYYWWKFRYGGKRYSLTPPRSSQLTQSEFLGAMYLALEIIEDFEMSDEQLATWASSPDPSDWTDDLANAVREAAEMIRDAGEQANENRDNMPEALQDGPTGEMLQERYDSTQDMADELESKADDIEGWDEVDPDEEDHGEPWDDLKMEATDLAQYDGE